VEITCRVYRPRRARDTPLFRLVEQHLEELPLAGAKRRLAASLGFACESLRVYEERFAKRANEILRKASAYFAQAELDRRAK
jgi:hypothetical protein